MVCPSCGTPFEGRFCPACGLEAPPLPSPGASPTPPPSVTGDPAAALDEARDRLRRRAADLRAEMEGESPPP